MKAPTYPEADQRAPARPTTNRMPAAPWLFCRFLIAFVKMSLAGPGATLPRLSISGWVAEWPTSPRIETSASSAGKIARIP
jgi:hypothetical protein